MKRLMVWIMVVAVAGFGIPGMTLAEELPGGVMPEGPSGMDPSAPDPALAPMQAQAAAMQPQAGKDPAEETAEEDKKVEEETEKTVKETVGDVIDEVFDDTGFLEKTVIKVLVDGQIDDVIEKVEEAGGTVDVGTNEDGDAIVLEIDLGIVDVDVTISWPEPTIDPERIETVIDKLEEAGLDEKAETLEELLEENPEGVPEDDLEDAGFPVKVDPDPKEDVETDVDVHIDPEALEALEEVVDAVTDPIVDIIEVIIEGITPSCSG